MEIKEFWNLIQSSLSRSSSDQDIQYQYLINELSKKPVKEIYSFDKILNKFHSDSYTSDLWAAAYIVNGGCSDDGFDYFRAWLISRGQEVYEKVMLNPESLTDYVSDQEIGEVENESFLYIADEAYQMKTNKNNYWVSDSSLLGDPIPDLVFDWTESEESLAKKFPRLVEKFW